MPKEITEKDVQPWDHPGDGWFIIEAAGEHPTLVGPDKKHLKRVVQELTPDVLAAIADAGVPEEGLFIDKDHRTVYDEDAPTEALGWLRELALCGGNLAGRIEWSCIGQPLIAGRAYKHFSTVYPYPTAAELQSGRMKPTHLIGLALTNKPNNKTGQPPITNRELPEPDNQNKPTHTTMDNPELLALLGLPEGATEEDVLNAVRDLKKSVDASAEAEAEALVNSEEKEQEAELTNEEKEECKEEIIANREHGLRYTRYMCIANRATRQEAGQKAAAAAAPTSPAMRRYAGKTPAIANAARDNAARQELDLHRRAAAICREVKSRGQSIAYHTALERARSEAASALNV